MGRRHADRLAASGEETGFGDGGVRSWAGDGLFQGTADENIAECDGEDEEDEAGAKFLVAAPPEARKGDEGEREEERFITEDREESIEEWVVEGLIDPEEEGEVEGLEPRHVD
jgi:hypothetical protein